MTDGTKLDAGTGALNLAHLQLFEKGRSVSAGSRDLWAKPQTLAAGQRIFTPPIERSAREVAPARRADYLSRMSSTELGKLLVMIGTMTALVGGVLWLSGGRIPLGRLPGDINLSGQNGSFHFPIVTCLLVSAVLSVVLWLLRR